MPQIACIRTSAVFPMSQLDTHARNCLLVAAKDSACESIARIGERFLIYVSDDPEKNAPLHGAPALQRMLLSAQDSGCQYIEVDPCVAAQEEMRHSLPFGIELVCQGGAGHLVSSLAQQFIDDSEQDHTGIEVARGEAASDAMESLILAMAGEGFDVSNAAFVRALSTAVCQTGNNL